MAGVKRSAEFNAGARYQRRLWRKAVAALFNAQPDAAFLDVLAAFKKSVRLSKNRKGGTGRK